MNTEQEAFWSGSFGDEYTARNASADPQGRMRILSEIISRTRDVSSVLEFGANIGLNIRALQKLLPKATFSAVEINSRACDELRKTGAECFLGSVSDYIVKRQFDFVLFGGLLIHLPPEELPKVYAKAVQASSRYICVIEYYNPTPVMIPYRGYEHRLWKRDFAGEMIEGFGLKLVDYGFLYHLDGGNDQTWFLLEKP